MQNGREGKQEDINNQLPSIPEEEENGEGSAISTKGNSDLQRPGLVPNQTGTTIGQEMAETQSEISGNSQSEWPAISNLWRKFENTARY